MQIRHFRRFCQNGPFLAREVYQKHGLATKTTKKQGFFIPTELLNPWKSRGKRSKKKGIPRKGKKTRNSQKTRKGRTKTRFTKNTVCATPNHSPLTHEKRLNNSNARSYGEGKNALACEQAWDRLAHLVQDGKEGEGQSQ